MIYTPPRVCRERFTVTDSEIVHVLPIYLVRLHSYLLHSYIWYCTPIYCTPIYCTPILYLWYLWCTYHKMFLPTEPTCTVLYLYLLRLTRVRLYELSTLLAMP